MKKFRFLFVFTLCFSASFAYGELLTIDDYLGMVAKNNSDLKSIQASIDAVNGKLAEIERVYAYSLSAGVSYSKTITSAWYVCGNMSTGTTLLILYIHLSIIICKSLARVIYDVEKFEDKGNSFKIDRTLTKKGTRADVLAALEDVNTALYDQETSQRNRGADLLLEGKYSLNGVDQFSGKSFDHVKNGNRPS